MATTALVPLLDVSGAVVDYHVSGRPTVHAVAGVSLQVGAGEIVGLVGESGCGKSTLGRAIVGLQKLTTGTVLLDGHGVSPVGRGARPKADRGLQMVFQDPYSSLNPRRRIGRQIADGLAAGLSRSEQRRQVIDLLDSVGLSGRVADRFPHEFSGGQRQRIAIARALAPQPALIVADEPVSALDASTRAQVSNLLVTLARERNMGLLFISHDLSGVRHMADRVAVMYLGRIVETSPTEPLWASPLHPYSDALVRAIPALGLTASRPVAPVGEVPDPSAPPSGCRFHPRCPYAMDRCLTDDPALVHVEAVAAGPRPATHGPTADGPAATHGPTTHGPTTHGPAATHGPTTVGATPVGATAVATAREAACWLQPEGGPAMPLAEARHTLIGVGPGVEGAASGWTADRAETPASRPGAGE